MARTLADLPASRVLGTEQVKMQTAYVTIGGSGAVSTSGTGYRIPSGFAISNSGTGTFTVTYAASPSAVIIPFIQLSAAATVVDAVPSAFSATAGTMTLKTLNASGAATNPASGDVIGFLIFGTTVGTSAL